MNKRKEWFVSGFVLLGLAALIIFYGLNWPVPTLLFGISVYMIYKGFTTPVDNHR